MNIDLGSLAKSLGIKGGGALKRPAWAVGAGKGAARKSKPRASSPPRDPEEEEKKWVSPQEEARRKALEEDRKLYKRYHENRLLRFHKLIETVPELAKYSAMLDKCGRLDCFEVYTKDDCNLDIAELIERYGLKDKLDNPNDRYFVFEMTRDWLLRQAKAHDKYTEDVDPNTFFVQPPATALSEAKSALGLH